MLLMVLIMAGCATLPVQEPVDSAVIEPVDDPETMEIKAKIALDDIQIERDEIIRLEKIQVFQSAFPESRYLAQCIFVELLTLGQLNRQQDVVSRSAFWLKRFPSDSRVLRAVAESLMDDADHARHILYLADNALQMELAGQTPFVSADEPLAATQERRTRYRLTLIQALVKNGKYDAAMNEVDKALKQVPNNDMGLECAIHRFRGDILNETGHPHEAKKAYLTSVILGDPRNRHAGYALQQLESYFPNTTHAERMDKYREMAGYIGPVFDDVTEETGLSEYRTGRVAWADINGNGYPDILLNGSILLKNMNGERFEDVTEKAGLLPGGRGGLFADVNNNGYPDILALRVGDTPEDGNRLLLNDGTGRFTQADPFSGSNPGYRTEGAAWCDMNGNGLPDLYLANYEMDVRLTGGQRGVGTPDEIFLNRSDVENIRFENISALFVPPDGTPLSGRGVSCADFNNNGKQDIFVSNYRLQQNFLWVNQGNMTFQNEALKRGVAGTDTDGWWGHTIGSVWGDLNNNGYLDLFSANLAHPRYIEFSDISQLLINSGPPDYVFTDVIENSGITFDETHSNPALADIDNDGDLDLYITSIYENERSYLYLNDGSGVSYQEIGFLSGTRVYNGWGCAFADFTGNGHPDLLVGSGSGIRLFRNRGNTNNWVQVEVRGGPDTGTAIGARVTVTQNGRKQIREIQAGFGTTSQDSAIQHFGLGNDDTPVTIHVQFTSGQTITHTEIPVSQRFRLN